MTKKLFVKVVALGGLLVAQTVWATNGFRPGLWAITSVFTGSLSFTSHGSRCLQSLGHGHKAVAMLGPTGGPAGPVAIQVKRGPHVTEVTWRDHVRQGSISTSDHGSYRFTDHAHADLLQGFWSRIQTFPGRTTVLHAVLHGRRVSPSCPGVLPTSTVSSSALQKLMAGTTALNAADARQQARYAQLKSQGKIP